MYLASSSKCSAGSPAWLAQAGAGSMTAKGRFPATTKAVVELQNRLARGEAVPRVRRRTGTHPRRTPSLAPQMLTIADVARRLNVSETTVYRMVLQGDLPASKVGPRPAPGPTDRRPWRFRPDDLDKYIEGQRYDPFENTWLREVGRE